MEGEVAMEEEETAEAAAKAATAEKEMAEEEIAEHICMNGRTLKACDVCRGTFEL
jgi:hypothetical protein